MARLSSESTRLSLVVLHSTRGTLRGEASFFFLLIEKEKKRLCLNHVKSFEVVTPPNSGLVNLVFSPQTGFLREGIRLLINR